MYGDDKIKEQEEQFRLLREQQEREKQRKIEQERRASGVPQNETIQPSAPTGDNVGGLSAEELAALAISQQGNMKQFSGERLKIYMYGNAYIHLIRRLNNYMSPLRETYIGLGSVYVRPSVRTSVRPSVTLPFSRPYLRKS